MAALRKPIPEIDVFYRGSLKALIKTPDGVECGPTHGAEPSPERFRVARSVPVNECMRKVLVGRYETGRTGTLVVRTEHCRHVRTRLENARKALDCLWGCHYVGIHEDENVSDSRRRRGVSGNCRSFRAVNLD